MLVVRIGRNRNPERQTPESRTKTAVLEWIDFGHAGGCSDFG